MRLLNRSPLISKEDFLQKFLMFTETSSRTQRKNHTWEITSNKGLVISFTLRNSVYYVIGKKVYRRRPIYLQKRNCYFHTNLSKYFEYRENEIQIYLGQIIETPPDWFLENI